VKESLGMFASPEKRNPMVCLLLAVITLALYNPVNRHPFVNYDDDRYVVNNPHVRQGLTAETVGWALTSTEQANWHPLTWMSHAIDCSLYGLNPVGHHFTSVLLHGMNVILLFLLLKWATGRLGPSLFVAALFALHPMNVESVAWVAERKNVLCTMFFFLALWAYGWYSRKPGWQRYLAVAALFAAGLASKPMVITFPFVLLLLDYWPLARVRGAGIEAGVQSKVEADKTRPTFSWSQLAIEKLPLLTMSAASAVITMRAQQAGGAVRTTAEVSFGARIATAIYAYAMYLWKMVWPARLAPLYPHPGDSLAAWQVLVAALVLLAITAFAWRFRARRYLLVGWLWFLGTLVPVIGLVQVGEAAMADRYAYIPLIGIFVMIAFGVADWAEEKRLGLWPAFAAAVVLVALAFVTHRQIGYWQSNYELWSHTLAVTENNFVAENNLGGALILEGREEDAHPHFEAAARINPRDPMSRSNLGIYLQNHHQMREAVAEYEAAVELTSDPGLLAQTYANLGAAQRALGEDEAARLSFEQSLRLNPNQPNAWLGLGLLAQKQGKLDEAISDLSRSVELQPNARGYFELGRTLAQAGHAPEALDAYQQALKISADFVEAQQAADALRLQKK
jgi:tetratricopeptide (TPR) repeat protein